ncbi:MAG: MFS transporter, partial [Planctomycetota bacterium]
MKLPNLLATPKGRLTAFFCLYMTEGIPIGFAATAIARKMREQGATTAEVGLFVGALYLPWSWKFLIGPIVDTLSVNRWGWRRTWIIGAQIGMCLTLLAALPVDFANEVKLFTLIITIHNIFGATQDVAIDALAVGTLDEKERGFANGLMFAGAYTGQAIGGAGVLYLTQLVDFNMTFFLVAACIFSVTLFVALPMKEPRHVKATNSGRHPAAQIGFELTTYVVQVGKAFFGSKPAFFGLVFALLPCGAYALSLALQSNLCVELG